MELSAKYSPSEVEDKWYAFWLEHKFFHSEPNEKEPYTIVIPPPNVTGVLHMGHVLNETIQDILVRRARMDGKNACWVPGTDHASIATEAKVIKRLAEQGIKKSDLTREEFLKHAWAWTDEHGGIILKQLRKLGCSCDWDRTSFTMDETRSKAVIKVFCDLYDKGLIYRGLRMVNWDPERQTALSDEEVIYHDEHSKFYYLKYMVAEEPGKYAVVATTRPETIFGDVAVCINPKEEKNQWLKGKHLIVPIVGREIPVIEDRYVEIGFGTGCLKVTPAHDANDYMLGQVHNLPAYDILTADAHVDITCLEEDIQKNCQSYQGMDRFVCRKQIAKDLEAAGLIEKIEDYDNKVGYSERTNVPIEPRLSLQWFIRMQHFADIALPPVMDDDIQFYPAKYKNTYNNWLSNIKDWCISRQLWWGHRIPAYFLPGQEGVKDENRKYVVAPTAEEALVKARQIAGYENIEISDLKQDEGALDTWFSSWLWPISLFDGIENPDNDEINYYYPTSDLVTGPDIIFFWVARMIMAGYEYKQAMPFKHVYFTGIVRDKLGRKMSKSLGNSPDPLDLIARFGADGVRMGIMLSAPAGNDILFDDSLCEQGRNFCNKIWNAFRLVTGWNIDDSAAQPEASQQAVKWFANKLNAVVAEVNDAFSKFRISDALMTIYKLFWDDFCSWYLEIIKPAYGAGIDKQTYEATIKFFGDLLVLLHPYMPFITEELWQNLGERAEGETIMFQPTPKAGEYSQEFLAAFELVQGAVNNIRGIRQQKNLSPKEALELKIKGNSFPAELECVITKLANISSIEKVDAWGEEAGVSFVVGIIEMFIPLAGLVNVDEEIAKIKAELEHQYGFLQGVRKKLSNESFVAHAPEKVIAIERKKESDALSRIATYEAQLKVLESSK
ncbi:MAG: valine--tRNA ligase [Bacteroidales bacterium]|nr:valine--tRNA ligase [Bacteroidales bacterium]